MAEDKFLRPIAKRIFARIDGKMFQMPSDILRKLFHRCIAPLRLLAQGHLRDIVEVAAQPPAEFLWRAVARRAHLRGSDVLRTIPHLSILLPADYNARFLRLDFADCARKFLRCAAGYAIWTVPGEQLV